ncbi:hypothetical protein ACFVFJ_44055 [Streptomyces sp. NPDC057717]|uniref:hypothetical protein n=1 Tax=Streptomyces sp. NPDC057717 TaxID=3346224 RepID=UPI0036A489FF
MHPVVHYLQRLVRHGQETLVRVEPVLPRPMPMVDHPLIGDLPSSGPVRNDAGTDRARDTDGRADRCGDDRGRPVTHAHVHGSSRPAIADGQDPTN